MSSAEAGRKAKATASVYLEMRGFKIIEQNWHRPNAEINIVAEKDNVRHFIEVKYRSDVQQAGELEVITTAKLSKMRRAAETYVEENKWQGKYILSAIEITGDAFVVLSFTENVF